AVLDARGNPLQVIVPRQQIARDLARRAGQGEGWQQQSSSEQHAPRSHASPPARSASGIFLGFEPGLCPSACLYHIKSHAPAIITRIPNTLVSSCIQKAADISVMAKWAAKERKMPRQKISSECCPQAIAGRSQRDFRPGQSMGTKWTVMMASARKWAKRRTSRLTLSMGQLHSSRQCAPNL